MIRSSGGAKRVYELAWRQSLMIALQELKGKDLLALRAVCTLRWRCRFSATKVSHDGERDLVKRREGMGAVEWIVSEAWQKVRSPC